MKLAINMSDGVIQGSAEINPELSHYIKKSGKPFLPYHDEDTYIPVFNEFYDQILASHA